MYLWTSIKLFFTREFSEKYCKDDGSIDWEKILEVNSAKKKTDDIA